MLAGQRAAGVLAERVGVSVVVSLMVRPPFPELARGRVPGTGDSCDTTQGRTRRRKDLG